MPRCESLASSCSLRHAILEEGVTRRERVRAGMPGGPGGLGRPPVEMMQPRPGLVFKTRTIPPKGSGEQPRKVFINVVMHELVKKPLNASMEEVGQDHIENTGISNLRVPLDVGEARQVCMPDQSCQRAAWHAKGTY